MHSQSKKNKKTWNTNCQNTSCQQSLHTLQLESYLNLSAVNLLLDQEAVHFVTMKVNKFTFDTLL